MGEIHELFLHCIFSDMSLVINGLCPCPLLPRVTSTLTKKIFIPLLHRNVVNTEIYTEIFFIKLTNVGCFSLLFFSLQKKLLQRTQIPSIVQLLKLRPERWAYAADNVQLMD